MKDRKMLRWIAGFLAALSFCALLCQKVDYLMCPETAVIYAEETALEPDGEKYDTVVPTACLTPKSADEYAVYYVQDGRAYQATVRIAAEKDGLAAVSGGLPPGIPIVRYSTKPLQDGMKVRVTEEITS